MTSPTIKAIPMHMLTRICYNSADWQWPTGDAPKLEAAKSYSVKYGFGHEEWIFRSEWLIDGWRYAFLQGVNRSYKRVSKADIPFDVTLYTILGDKRRRYVANITAVECLSNDQANDALDAFKRFGWYDRMIDEIRSVGGDAAALGAVEYTRQILNVRFRLDNVERFPQKTFAKQDDPINRLRSYQLVDTERLWQNAPRSGTGQSGSTTDPNVVPYKRSGSCDTQCSPEHARMQKKLMEELRRQYPRAKVVRERNHIDVSVRTDKELILFEIKSDLDPRTVIRQALGQILEYAYHPRRKHDLPVKLVIVGRKALSSLDEDYLERLINQFQIPLAYRVVKL